MDRSGLVGTLGSGVPAELAEDLVDDFLKLREDGLTGTLERASAGKFVESLVQVLQELETGTHEKQPSVDSYLKGLESRSAKLDDGLRICASRIGRSMYTLRSKRNIVHKGEVDPNAYDLRYLVAASQWVMAELIRVTGGSSMKRAGQLIDQVQAPVGGLVEDFGDRRLVLKDLNGDEEMLVLLHSHYPKQLSVGSLESSMNRLSAGYVRKIVRELWREKLVEGDGTTGYKLTGKGQKAAREIMRRVMENGGS